MDPRALLTRPSSGGGATPMLPEEGIERDFHPSANFPDHPLLIE